VFRPRENRLAPVVLAETSWVLERAYHWSSESIAQALEMLTSTDKFTMDETSAEAVSLYQLHHAEDVGFADCLILRASKRALPLYTFDPKFQKLKNVQPIT
jgi:predicted nucleic-acid-binding protein